MAACGLSQRRNAAVDNVERLLKSTVEENIYSFNAKSVLGDPI
jgi:hypothetical protein